MVTQQPTRPDEAQEPALSGAVQVNPGVLEVVDSHAFEPPLPDVSEHVMPLAFEPLPEPDPDPLVVLPLQVAVQAEHEPSARVADLHDEEAPVPHLPRQARSEHEHPS